MKTKIKKFWKVGCYALAYAAEIGGLTYFSTKLKSSHEEGEISTAQYAIGNAAAVVGYMATAFPTVMKGLTELEDAYYEDDENDE